jgi:hypothetical protein
MRNVVIHYHIFKNAGTSIDRILINNYRSAWSPLEGKTPTSLLSVRDVEEFLASRPDIQAISSHLARPPLPRSLNAIPIVFLRDPIDRAASIFHFERRGPSNVMSSEIAKSGDFRKYVTWCLHAREGWYQGGVVIKNYQVVHLSNASLRNGHIYRAEAEENDVAEALQFLDSIPFFGIVEEFAKSIRLLEETLRPAWHNFSAENTLENVAPNRIPIYEERVATIKRELGEELFQALNDANRLDTCLYTIALQKFRQRLSKQGLC